MMNAALDGHHGISIFDEVSRADSSSPIGDCSDTGSWAIRWISATRSAPSHLRGDLVGAGLPPSSGAAGAARVTAC